MSHLSDSYESYLEMLMRTKIALEKARRNLRAAKYEHEQALENYRKAKEIILEEEERKKKVAEQEKELVKKLLLE